MNFGDFVPNRIRDLDRVRTGLLEHDQAQRVRTIDAHIVANVRVRIVYVSDVAHVNRNAIAGSQGYVEELVHTVELAAGAQQNVKATLFHRADRSVEVLVPHCVDDLGHR